MSISDVRATAIDSYLNWTMFINIVTIKVKYFISLIMTIFF